MNEQTTQFQDTADREWNLDITIGVARKIKQELKVDLSRIVDGKVFIELSCNRETLAGVLWLLVESQAERAGVTPEDFATSLGGDALDAAMDALREAIIRFTPRHQREAVRALFDKTMMAQDASGLAATTWIEANAEALVTAKIEEAIAKLPTSFGRT